MTEIVILSTHEKLHGRITDTNFYQDSIFLAVREEDGERIKQICFKKLTWGVRVLDVIWFYDYFVEESHYHQSWSLLHIGPIPNTNVRRVYAPIAKEATMDYLIKQANKFKRMK